MKGGGEGGGGKKKENGSKTTRKIKCNNINKTERNREKEKKKKAREKKRKKRGARAGPCGAAERVRPRFVRAAPGLRGREGAPAPGVGVAEQNGGHCSLSVGFVRRLSPPPVRTF